MIQIYDIGEVGKCSDGNQIGVVEVELVGGGGRIIRDQVKNMRGLF